MVNHKKEAADKPTPFLPKSKNKGANFRPSKKGRKGRWGDDQLKIIEASTSVWHNYACVELKDRDGGDDDLAEWKKEEANRLLRLEAFQSLPSGVSIILQHRDLLLTL